MQVDITGEVLTFTSLLMNVHKPVVIISRVEYQWAISPAMARSWLLAVILCVFALHMRTTSQQICSPMNSVPMVDPNSPNTADQIVASCTSVGPSDPISNPVWYLNGVNMNESRCLRGSTRSPDAHQLTFTITPDCEGYVQCGIPPMQATCAVSRPRPIYCKACAHSH